MKKTGLVLFFFIATLAMHVGVASELPVGSHCVAYKAKKRMFLIRTVKVLGKNCNIVSQVIPDVGGVYSYKLEIPIENFDSGDEERDKDVRKILKQKAQDSLYFYSEKMSKKEWQKLMVTGKSFSINGTLSMAGQETPIKASVKLIKTAKGFEADGIIYTQFKSFNLQPPKLFGGLMASVKEELELHFHLQSDKTLGFESLMQ